MQNMELKLASGLAMMSAYLRGWRTRQKIVVIESDDWGSIRTSSPEAYNRLVASGYHMDRSPWSLDALETDTDLRKLFEVLESVRDRRGRPACMTANMIVANPDFERIRQAHFRKYFYEPTIAILLRQYNRRDIPRLWKEGLNRKVFVPQLHAREHVCWWRWLEALRNGSQEALETFELKMCGVPMAVSKEKQSFFTPLYLVDEELAKSSVDPEQMVREGASLFKKQLGYGSLSSIAPNDCWTDHVELIWIALGVRYVQTALLQLVGCRHRRPHFLAERSQAGCLYIVRNCIFEPVGGIDWVDRCFKQVAWAFRFRKPAVICSHRVNFIGAIRPENRDSGLRQLKDLLSRICQEWPDVYFLSTTELGYMIEHNIKDVQELPDVALTGCSLQGSREPVDYDAGMFSGEDRY